MDIKGERGQALFVVLFAMVALLVIVGLAIDGGQLYKARRDVQTAADAAALAGTRELSQAIVTCSAGGSAQDRLVRDAIVEYAALNGVIHDDVNGRIWAWYVDKNQARLSSVGLGSVPDGATGVEVSMVVTHPTAFLRVVGQNDIVAPGEALAMAGRLTQMSGNLMPVGVPDEVIGQINPNDTLWIFDDGRYCRDNAGSECLDTGNSAAYRGWFNFNYIYNLEHLPKADPLYRTITTSRSNADIKNWLQGIGVPVIFAGNVGATDGDYIYGDTGERAGAMDEIYDTYEGETIYFPVYDMVYSGEYLAQYPGIFRAPEGGWANTIIGKKNAFMYHIVGYVAAIPTGVSKDGLRTSFQTSIIGQGQIQPGDGLGTCSNRMLTYAVTLWR